MSQMDGRDLKYPGDLIIEIAQELNIGMTCFINPHTMELATVLGGSYDAYQNNDDTDLEQEVYDKVDSWERFIRIEPPKSWQSFQIMERFIENCIPDNDAIKQLLCNAISKRKPFRNFMDVIDNSKYRQCWFDYKQSQIELFVMEQLS